MSTETTKAVPFLSEKTLLDAPLGYSNAEASAWASGYNSAADDAQAELTRLRQLVEEARVLIKLMDEHEGAEGWSEGMRERIAKFITEPQP